MWSRVGGLGWGCGPGQNDQAEGVVQSRKHKLRVWSRAGIGNQGSTLGLQDQNKDVIGNWKFHTRPLVDWPL